MSKQPKTTKKPTSNGASRFKQISDAANEYGGRSFDNYAKIRSLAEQIQASLCAYLRDDDEKADKCVYLVPPQGAFGSRNYGSAAFSVSGKGFLPLEPISFGLGVRVTTSGDFMRLVLNCRKEGEHLYLSVDQHKAYDFELPINEDDIAACKEGLFQHLLHWFADRVERYDHGDYGSTDIGFDIQRIDGA